MEKKSGSMFRKLIHRDSLPQLSFGHGASKDKPKTRRKSEGMLTVPEYFSQENTMPVWYRKEIKTRDAAEDLLNTKRVGTFLVRDSETSKLPGSYTLSLLHKDKCRHHKIETNPRNSKLVIKSYENHQFDDLTTLVDFFIRSQRKDIKLIPYDPNAVDDNYPEDCVDHGQASQSVYEEMDGCNESNEEYQSMGNGNDGANHRISPGIRHGLGAPPRLPTRRESSPQLQSYENLAPRSLPPQPPPPSQSYENLPPKGAVPVPLPPRPDDVPPLPPRVRNTGQSSYENIPERPMPTSRNNDNYGVQPSGYDNYLQKGSQHHSAPGHSYQNLPPKVTPRRTGRVAYSAEQELPPRKPGPLRRSRTDTEQDWHRRGYK